MFLKVSTHSTYIKVGIRNPTSNDLNIRYLNLTYLGIYEVDKNVAESRLEYNLSNLTFRKQSNERTKQAPNYVNLIYYADTKSNMYFIKNSIITAL